MQTFEVKPEHIKLLRAAYVSWDSCEYGAPAIDCKRPYGNSAVIGDIHYQLTGEYLDDEPPDELYSRYEKLHKETQTALQIVLATGTFRPGRYQASDYGIDWTPAESKQAIR